MADRRHRPAGTSVVIAVDEPFDDSAAIDRMLDDGAPTTLRRATRRSARSPLILRDEPSMAERAERRRSARRVFRLGCLACGRSAEVRVAPARAGRCAHCGGSMLLELA